MAIASQDRSVSFMGNDLTDGQAAFYFCQIARASHQLKLQPMRAVLVTLLIFLALAIFLTRERRLRRCQPNRSLPSLRLTSKTPKGTRFFFGIPGLSAASPSAWKPPIFQEIQLAIRSKAAKQPIGARWENSRCHRMVRAQIASATSARTRPSARPAPVLACRRIPGCWSACRPGP
jgi:hypothetical protein